MQPLITEEQIEDRRELFFKILDDFIEENYDVSEDYVMTEEEAYITSIILEYFEENYRFPTLQEAAYESMTGYDINTPLYEELYDVLLDESIGSFVAGARYGIKDFLAKKAKDRASTQAKSAKATSQKMTGKADKAAASAAKSANGKGILGKAKASYAANKSAAISDRAAKAKAVYKAAETNRKSKQATSQNVSGRRGALAQRVDQGVENLKNKAKSGIEAAKSKAKDAIEKGASKVGGFLGRVAGKFA